MSSTDRIEKHIELRAPRARVWRALTNAREFGTWFRAEFEGEFAAGQPISGQITVPGYEHAITLQVERIDPQERFSFRWHPYALDASHDYSNEPTTLIEFRLAETVDGTTLTVTESGFDALPAERRDLAFRMNDKGWSSQLKNIEKHVTG
jgi:uncharacterized protein YndB with AHSA1/START domain